MTSDGYFTFSSPQGDAVSASQHEVSPFKELNQPRKKHISKTVQDLSIAPGLSRLVLSNNGLTSLQGMEELRDVEFLYLQYNHLRDFEYLGVQPKLRELHAENNEIVSLRGLKAQPKLREIHLRGNPITRLPLYRVMCLLAVGNALRKIDDDPVSSLEREQARQYGPAAAEAVRQGMYLNSSPMRHDKHADSGSTRLPSNQPLYDTGSPVELRRSYSMEPTGPAKDGSGLNGHARPSSAGSSLDRRTDSEQDVASLPHGPLGRYERSGLRYSWEGSLQGSPLRGSVSTPGSLSRSFTKSSEGKLMTGLLAADDGRSLESLAAQGVLLGQLNDMKAKCIALAKKVKALQREVAEKDDRIGALEEQKFDLLQQSTKNLLRERACRRALEERILQLSGSRKEDGEPEEAEQHASQSTVVYLSAKDTFICFLDAFQFHTKLRWTKQTQASHSESTDATTASPVAQGRGFIYFDEQGITFEIPPETNAAIHLPLRTDVELEVASNFMELFVTLPDKSLIVVEDPRAELIAYYVQTWLMCKPTGEM